MSDATDPTPGEGPLADEESRPPLPFVRVRDANLARDGGPVRVTVSRLEDPDGVADALASAGARPAVEHERVTVSTTPSRLVDAVGRTRGRVAAEQLETVLDVAVANWLEDPTDLDTPVGALECAERAIVMGIVNVTPDSFSDGGEHFDPERHPDLAVEHGRALARAGADVVDVGGESTRPGAEPVPEDVETERVLPVVERLVADDVVVSVDTSKAAVARACVEAGAALVNDVSAGALDGLMLPTIAELDVPYVLMHMRGTPRTMQRDPTYHDVVAEVYDFLAEGIERAGEVGIDSSRIIVDPGIGFGKTVDHNLVLLRRLREFTSLGRPVLVGASRKSFLGRVAGGRDEGDRLEESLAAAAVAVAAGASIVRVHDVEQTVRAVGVARAISTAVQDRPEDEASADD